MTKNIKSDDVEKFLLRNSSRARWTIGSRNHFCKGGRNRGIKRFWNKEGKSIGWLLYPTLHELIYPWMVAYRIQDIDLCVKFLTEQEVSFSEMRHVMSKYSTYGLSKAIERDPTLRKYV